MTNIMELLIQNGDISLIVVGLLLFFIYKMITSYNSSKSYTNKNLIHTCEAGIVKNINDLKLDITQLQVQLKSIEDKISNVAINDKFTDNNIKELTETIRDLSSQLNQVVYVMSETDRNIKNLIDKSNKEK